MNHPAELALSQYLADASNGKTTISDETIEAIGERVKNAVKRQFGGGNDRSVFSLRMSNIGRPSCQLWHEKNKPETAEPLPNSFVMNMLLGDIVEAVFYGLLTEAGVQWKGSEKVTLQLGDKKINGSYDIIVNGKLDDIKSASNWSYTNKFVNFDTLKNSDPFGYVGQLAGYSEASETPAGGWWVINKANGEFKYVPADGLDTKDELTKLQENVERAESEELIRCFEPYDETFNGKPTGNKVLPTECMFCRFRKTCWPTLQELPQIKSKAKTPKTMGYVEIKQKETVNGE